MGFELEAFHFIGEYVGYSSSLSIGLFPDNSFSRAELK